MPWNTIEGTSEKIKIVKTAVPWLHNFKRIFLVPCGLKPGKILSNIKTGINNISK